MKHFTVICEVCTQKNEVDIQENVPLGVYACERCHEGIAIAIGREIAREYTPPIKL